MKNILKLSLLCLTLLFSSQIIAQNALLDEIVQAGELSLFPDINNKNNYYYLLDKARIATKPNGDPNFTFVEYVDRDSKSSDISGIEDAPGGGFFHALIEFNVSDEMLSVARSDLRRINSSAKIMGPALYDFGTVKLITSLLDTDGNFIQQVAGLGAAPILENQGVAVSIALTKKGAIILRNVFNSENALLALGFEMQLSGYRSPRQVTIEANFDNIYKNQNIQAAAVTPVFASEINTTFDELRKTGGIKVTQINADEDMEKAMETAYNKLTQIIFDLNGGGAPNAAQMAANVGGKKSMLDRVSGMLDKARKEVREDNKEIARNNDSPDDKFAIIKKIDANAKKTVDELNKELGYTPSNKPADNKSTKAKVSEKPKELPSFAVGVSYTLKKERRSGSYKIDLNKYTVDTKPFPFSENITIQDCASCFLKIDTEDEFYKQRIINAQLDGFNASSFNQYINFVTLLVQKEHQNGEVTQREIKIDKTKFNESANNFKMTYGWKDDAIRNNWLQYKYKTVWSFFGGFEQTSDWIPYAGSIITLAPQFRTKKITIEADSDFVNDNNIRAIDVRLYYKLGEQEYTRETTLNFSKEDGASKSLEIIVANNTANYSYDATIYVKGQDDQEIIKTTTRSSSVYFDNF